MAFIGPTAPTISLTSKLVPAIIHAAAAPRNFAESPAGQIIPMYLDTQPQPAGGPVPRPTDDGEEPAEIEPVGCESGRGWLCPDIFELASAME